MERHMELIRLILKYIRKNGKPGQVIQDFDIPGYSDDQVLYHARLCSQAGFIDGFSETMQGSFTVRMLTWQGQNELDRLCS